MSKRCICTYFKTNGYAVVTNASSLSKMTMWKEENRGKKAGTGSITAGGWRERHPSMAKPLLPQRSYSSLCRPQSLSQYPFVSFFLPSLIPVSYPSYLFSSAFFSFLLTAFYFTFSFSISFLSPFHPSHGRVTREGFLSFRPSFHLHSESPLSLSANS